LDCGGNRLVATWRGEGESATQFLGTALSIRQIPAIFTPPDFKSCVTGTALKRFAPVQKSPQICPKNPSVFRPNSHKETPGSQSPRMQQVAKTQLLEFFCCQIPRIFLFSSSIATRVAWADTIRLVARSAEKRKNKQLTTNNIGGTR